MQELDTYKYCKFEAILTRGRICQYIEFTDDWATRQVEEFPDDNEWFFCGADSSQRDKLRVCDRPFSAINIKEEHVIDRSEFQKAWAAANNWKIANTLTKV